MTVCMKCGSAEPHEKCFPAIQRCVDCDSQYIGRDAGGTSSFYLSPYACAHCKVQHAAWVRGSIPKMVTSQDARFNVGAVRRLPGDLMTEEGGA